MRLIDAEWLRRRINGTCSLKVISLDNLFFMIANAPSIDIVRCQECKYWHRIGCFMRDYRNADRPKADDFCSYGERKESK